MLRYIIVISTMVAMKNAEFTLTLLHTNDIHARFEQFTARGSSCREADAQEGKCFGGVARRIAAIKQIRSSPSEPNPVLLDGGDQYQGSLWFHIHKGSAAAHFMNAAKYDAMALGNHEFDLRPAGLAPFLHNVTFPVLSANMDASDEPLLKDLVQKSTVLDIAGEKVAIVGYTTQETSILSYPEKVKFSDEVEAVMSEVERLTSEGVNKIIALGHAGITVDRKLASSIPGLDIVVGGHTNTFLYSGDAPAEEVPEGPYPTVVEQSTGGQVLVVQDYAFGKYLGYLQVTFDDLGRVTSWNGNPILMNTSIVEDSGTLADMVDWQTALEVASTEIIGRSHVLLDGRREVCRLYECNMGNFITDGMVQRHLAHPDEDFWANISIALVNSGSIRASIKPGDISRKDILAVQPFGNTVDLIELEGRHLLEVLEYSVWDYNVNDRHGKFLQMSGLRVLYDLSKPNGQRVVSVEARCSECSVPKFEPLQVDSTYKILMRDFNIFGGDGYDMITKHMISHHVFGDVGSDLTMEYVPSASPIITGLDGRIQFVSNRAHTCTNSGVRFVQGYMLWWTLILFCSIWKAVC